MVKIGAKAPAFSLPDQDGKTTSLGDFAGRWVVLYFYPRDDTPGCTVEACEFTAAVPEFGKLDAEVLGCSSDGAAAHQRFIGKHRLGIRLLTDQDRKVMKAYGAFGTKVMYGKEVEGIIRSTTLIAPDGTVAHHWAKVKAAGHADAVRERLAALRSGAADVLPAKKAVAAKKSPKRPAAKKSPAKAVGAKRPVARKKAGKAK